jgi:hypothetical protein
MPIEDKYLYNLISCGTHPSIMQRHNPVTPSPYENLIVCIPSVSEFETYEVVPLGLNFGLTTGLLPPMQTTALDTCADAIADKLFIVFNCQNPKETRRVLTVATYPIGTVLRFTGEDSCWQISQVISNYDTALVETASYASCEACAVAVADTQCAYEERTLGYAVKIKIPTPEPADRGFAECCYLNLVFGDLGSTESYKNDYNSVFYKRQTASDTVAYSLIGESTGTTALVDVTHGVLYPFGEVGQPDLSYFKVEWRKILALLGEDTYKIRMTLSIAGVAVIKDTFPFTLRQFTTELADKTVRIDSNLDGKIVKIDTDFRNSGYTNSLRFKGFFGNATPNLEQDNVVFSSKKGLPYYSSQINMSNVWDYVFSAYRVPECMARVFYNELLWGNDLYLSDYNLNNHSYLYSLLAVEIKEDNNPTYNALSRLVDLNLTFSDRAKNNRKTNC